VVWGGNVRAKSTAVPSTHHPSDEDLSLGSPTPQRKMRAAPKVILALGGEVAGKDSVNAVGAMCRGSRADMRFAMQVLAYCTFSGALL